MSNILSDMLSANLVGDRFYKNDDSYELKIFLDAVFGRKRLIVIKIDRNKRKLKKQLETYCAGKPLLYTTIHREPMDVNAVKGDIEIIYEDGQPFYQRKKPEYIQDRNQMIVVDNLNKNTDVEILRAFCYMGFLGGYYDDTDNLPEDKLPYGSAYVFIADKNFPLDKFTSMSSHWKDESAVLDLRDFQAKAIDHLGQYKIKKLKITKKGLYNHKGERILYDHILPKDQEDLNVIEPYSHYLRSSEYLKGMKRHRYFHHLNSSQAMCINFFYPLIKRKELDSILRVLHIPGHIDYSKVKFEKESHIETGHDRKTNFDFFIRTKEGTNLYFEIKYTESEFGKVKDDTEHIEKFYRIYEPVLKNSSAISEDFKSKEHFFSNYQIMRNLIHIDDNSYVIFIYPKENTGIRKAALHAKGKILKPDWKKYLIPYTWEHLIKDIIQHLKSSSLVQYYKRDFTEKYLEV